MRLIKPFAEYFQFEISHNLMFGQLEISIFINFVLMR